MSELKEYKLGDFGTVVTGNTPSSKNPEDWGDQMLFVTPSDYKNYLKYANCSDRKLSSIGFSRLNKKILPPNSLLVTCIGSDMGKVVKASDYCITNQQINSIIPNDKFDSDFIYYKLIDLYDTLRIYGGDGTAVPIVNKTDFENIIAEVPENKEEQKRIAGILSSLDDKIDLLTRQNRTLEAMAETLFRQYFSEKDNDNTVEQLIYVQNGYAFKSQDFKEMGTNGVVKIKNISGGVININATDYIDSQIADAIHPKFRISSGDILIAMTGAEIGKLGIIPSTDKSLWLNQRVGLLAEKYKGAKYLAYLQLKSDFGQDYIENTATGSAQPNISGNGIEKCGFPKLSESDIIEYSYQIGELYDKVIFNLGQISTLDKLRNILLPKLMNGEITVNG